MQLSQFLYCTGYIQGNFLIIFFLHPASLARFVNVLNSPKHRNINCSYGNYINVSFFIQFRYCIQGNKEIVASVIFSSLLNPPSQHQSAYLHVRLDKFLLSLLFLHKHKPVWVIQDWLS